MEAAKQYLAIAILIAFGSAQYVYQQIVKGFNIIKPVLKAFLIGVVVTLIDWWSWVKIHAIAAFHNALINYAPRYEYAAFIDGYNATMLIDTLSTFEELTCAYLKLNLGASKLHIISKNVDVQINPDKKTAIRCNLATGQKITVKLAFGEINIKELLNEFPEVEPHQVLAE